MESQNQFFFEKEIVTPNGIKYGDSFFSSSKCIENKWFELAEKTGEWSIPIIVQPSNHREIVLFDIANSINQGQNFTPEMKQIYYQKMQEMKIRYFEINKPKKH